MITVAAWQQSIAIILVIVYSDGYQNNVVFEKIEPVAETGLRLVAVTVANLPSINYFITYFAEMVTRPLTSPMQPR